MASTFDKNVRGTIKDPRTQDGWLRHDLDTINPCQEECAERLAATLQVENEVYLNKHPEISAMLRLFISDIINKNRRREVLKQAGNYFTKPYEELHKEICNILNVPPEGPYMPKEYTDWENEVTDLESDLLSIILKHYPVEEFEVASTEPESPITISSSFLSMSSSATTLPTPEPTPPPEPTLSEVMYNLVVFTVDKATMARVTDEMIKYDTAYVEVMKIVEEAMEIPVIEIRIDIKELLSTAYANFETILNQKARIAAGIAWERRIRKKMKRYIRRAENFRGYETPASSTSELPSSHESYKLPPLRPCKCHPQWTFNRYPKDRFGIYIPLTENYPVTSITTTPVMSSSKLNNEEIYEA